MNSGFSSVFSLGISVDPTNSTCWTKVFNEMHVLYGSRTSEDEYPAMIWYVNICYISLCFFDSARYVWELGCSKKRRQRWRRQCHLRLWRSGSLVFVRWRTITVSLCTKCGIRLLACSSKEKKHPSWWSNCQVGSCCACGMFSQEVSQSPSMIEMWNDYLLQKLVWETTPGPAGFPSQTFFNSKYSESGSLKYAHHLKSIDTSNILKSYSFWWHLKDNKIHKSSFFRISDIFRKKKVSLEF